MRWQGRRQSDNIEDRRGAPAGGPMVVGGGMGLLIMLLLVWLLGGNPLQFLAQQMQQQGGVPGGGGGGQPRVATEAEEELKQFVAVVLADTEDVWEELFRDQLRKRYEKPVAVLFTDTVRSGCGVASAAVGPFYCPADHRVYLDLAFFDELKRRFNAPGDFAIAYVVAHEVGHHVQSLLGISDDVHQFQRRSNERESNRMSVRLELQADFLAGVWAHHAQRTKQILEAGDIEEAMRASEAVGDDAIQKQVAGQVTPDAFTHGSSAQRARWFKRGLQTGDLSQMNQLFELDYEKL